jgi:Secretion system C-terminal sorting domain/Domain of unknown function (DUF4886)
MKKALFVLIILLGISSISICQKNDTTKILFIGNSLTGFGNQPEKVRQFALEAGKNVLIGNQVIGGMQLNTHSHNQGTIDMVYSDDWDFVMLQGSDYAIAFPEYIHIIYEGFIRLDSMAQENNPDSKCFFFMDWAMKNGVTAMGVHYDYFTFQDMLYRGTLTAADSLEMMISPIGWAWKQSIGEHPEIDLFHMDLAHPSNKGAYLNACVYYAAIFRESVEGFDFIDDLDPVEAAYLQKIGSHMVLDSLELWNMITMTGVENQKEKNEFLVFPNPTTDWIHLEGIENIAFEIQIFDLSGRPIKSIKNETNFNLGFLKPGIYFLKTMNEKNTKIIKLIKK